MKHTCACKELIHFQRFLPHRKISFTLKLKKIQVRLKRNTKRKEAAFRRYRTPDLT
jgi:hypothetical protein